MHWFAHRPGGLGRYYSELLRHLPETGVESRGLVMGPPTVEDESGGTVIAVAGDQAKMWTRWRAIRRQAAVEIRRHHVDLVASHHSLYTFPLLRQVRKLPLLVHFHGPFSAECSAENSKFIANTAKHWMERIVYGRAIRCIALSKAFAAILRGNYGVPEQRIRVIAGAVETVRFDPAESRLQARAQLGWPTDRPIIVCIRRLYRRMGLENLISAVAKIRENVPEILVLIGGKGWLAEELQGRINADGLENHVRLLGFMPDSDLPLAYRAANLSVVPTLSLEGFGLTTVESMAAGTVPFVTPVGGLPEVVSGLSPDLVMRDSSPDAIAESLSGALRGDLKLPTSEQCRSFARENFDWSVIAPKVRSVYMEAIAAHGRSASS